MSLIKQQYDFVLAQEFGKNWAAYNGDSTEVLTNLPNDSIDSSIYSPAFKDLFTYSASKRDIGNSVTDKLFLEHYGFIVKELLRIHKPGRITCVHTQNIPAIMERDNYSGLKDFPGDVIRLHESIGWTWWGDFHVDRNPQAIANRPPHPHELQFGTLRKDATKLRPAIGHRILAFKKPGTNEIPVTPIKNGEITNEDWIRDAHPVWQVRQENEDTLAQPLMGYWYDIKDGKTLQYLGHGKYYSGTRSEDMVKHLCALQTGIIQRLLFMYSNPGEIVLDPFAGIFSTPYVAVKHNRQAIGCELVPRYYHRGVKNMHIIDRENRQQQNTLFNLGGLNNA